MASLNPLTQELVFKIVFYGPGLGGKTTNLQHIHGATKPENRGKLVSLATPTDRTLYFDYLPIKLAKVKNHGVRLQLFTVPGQVYYGATRKLVLNGADGVVFVADSQAARQEANQESLDDLNANLAEHGRSLSQMPHVFQWNKRDLETVTGEAEMDRRLNLFGAPSRGSIATSGEGVFETLEDITRLVVDAYRKSVPSNPRQQRVVLEEDTSLAAAVRGLTEKPVPPPATRPPSASVPGTFSLAEVWPEGEREAVRNIEQLVAAGDNVGAVLACDVLILRVLASTAGLAGASDAPRDPSVVWLLLGLDGARWLRFRTAVRNARAGMEVSATEALESLLTAAEARRARTALGG